MNQLVDHVHVESIFAVFLVVQEYFGELHIGDDAFDLASSGQARNYSLVIDQTRLGIGAAEFVDLVTQCAEFSHVCQPILVT